MKYEGSLCSWLNKEKLDNEPPAYILSIVNNETLSFKALRRGQPPATNKHSLRNSEQSTGIENLVNQLCIKLREVDGKGIKCLKEKTNQSKIELKFPASCPETSLKCCSLKEKENYWDKLGGRRWRCDKENWEGMRSRKGSQAKSLDRSGGTAPWEPPPQRRPPPPSSLRDEYNDLPMDFQELLESPEEKRCLVGWRGGGEVQSKFIEAGTNLTSSIWTQGGAPQICWPPPLDHPWLTQAQLIGLDHRQESRFARVKRGHGGGGKWREEKGEGEKGGDEVVGETERVAEEEEDLLTSMKTHFRPIKAGDEVGVVGGGVSSGGGYRDGSTFLVSASLEEIEFRRSESGALYIGAELKYMEYKEGRETPQHFVPKFRVRAEAEKFCQTEEGGPPDSPPESQFYFPGDDTFADTMIESEDDRCLEAWISAWPLSTQIWSSGGGGGETWRPIHSPTLPPPPSSKLRDELSKEGEELLSSLHLLVHPPPQPHLSKRIRIRDDTLL